MVVWTGAVAVGAGCGAGGVPDSSIAHAKAGNKKSRSQQLKRNNLVIIFNNLHAPY